MKAEIWLKTPWSKPKFYAKTTAYRKKNNGKWKKEKNRIVATANSIFRPDPDCVGRQDDTDTADCSNCKDKRAKTTGTSSRYTSYRSGELTSYHEVDFGNDVVFSVNKELIFCE